MQSADCVPCSLQTAYLAPCTLQTAQVLRLHATYLLLQIACTLFCCCYPCRAMYSELNGSPLRVQQWRDTPSEDGEGGEGVRGPVKWVNFVLTLVRRGSVHSVI